MLSEDAPKNATPREKVQPFSAAREESDDKENSSKRTRKRVRVTNSAPQRTVISTQNGATGGKSVVSSIEDESTQKVHKPLFAPIEKPYDRVRFRSPEAPSVHGNYTRRPHTDGGYSRPRPYQSSEKGEEGKIPQQTPRRPMRNRPAMQPRTGSDVHRQAERYYGASDKEYNERFQKNNTPESAEGRTNKRSPRKKEQKLYIQPPAKEVVSYPEYNVKSGDPIRLNKYLANAGVCSRRVADELIAQGKVTVNGEVVTKLGTTVTREDKIACDGKDMSIERKVYVLLNKPKNCVTTVSDEQGRTTVMDIVKNACTEKIFPVGRLDRNTTGVLLLTNDGDLAANLLHPSKVKKKIYQVSLDKPVSEEHMRQLVEGIILEDGEIHADAVSYIDEENLAIVGIEIHSGRNRIVRRMFQHLGYHVRSLDRVYFAGLTKKRLPRGHWRYLTEQEVVNLKMGRFD